MAKKEYETGAQIYPNSEFAPEKYYLLGAYVVLFNAISNNTVEYGLGNNNGDQIINDYIANHIDELNAQFNLHLEHIIPETVNGVVKRDSKGDVVYKKDVFKKMLPELIERAKSLSSQMGNRKDGYLTKMMTNDQLRHLLDEKRIKVKGWHEAVRKKAKGKSGDSICPTPNPTPEPVYARPLTRQTGLPAALYRPVIWDATGATQRNKCLWYKKQVSIVLTLRPVRGEGRQLWGEAFFCRLTGSS